MKCARSGLTQIELLMVITVVGLLVAILLPAVQFARESARRTNCASNLRQILMAMHEHQEAKGVFPGALHEKESWFVQILPYLEQQKPYRSANGVIMRTPTVPVYACPSDIWAHGQIVNFNFSYRMCDGLGQGSHDGFFAKRPFEPVSPRDVTDGLSNTVAFAESLVSPDPVYLSSLEFTDPQLEHRLVRRTSMFQPDLEHFAGECETRSTPPLNSLSQFVEYNHVQSPNRKSCTNGPMNDTRASTHSAITSTSAHPGGVQVGLGDGAVRFISNSIDRTVWRALGTRSRNEVVSTQWF